MPPSSRLPRGLIVAHHALPLNILNAAKNTINHGRWDDGTGKLEQRSVQHYGSETTFRSSERDFKINLNIPREFKKIIHHLRSFKILKTKPNQANVYSYRPGEGIHQHFDHQTHFENEIVMISLTGTGTLRFTNPTDGSTYDVNVLPGTAVIIRDDARYVWKHGIPSCLNSRVSLVFRRVIVPQPHSPTAIFILLLFLFYVIIRFLNYYLPVP